MLIKVAKPRRFFYHYNKHQDKWSIHFLGKCHIVDKIICNTAVESKKNNRQPKAVMQGFSKLIDISDDVGIIL